MADAPERKPHTLQDHVLGVDGAHAHEDDSDHDHDHDHDDSASTEPETDALWQQDRRRQQCPAADGKPGPLVAGLE